jgi:hypothetical protein
MRPTYYLKFDDHFPDAKRIEQVIAWLRMPAAQRPHFITLYYSTSIMPGINTAPTARRPPPRSSTSISWWAIYGRQLSRLQLPVDLIVVSDHGMEREQGPWIDLDKYTDLANFTTVGSLLYPNSEAAAEKAYQELKIKSDAFTVYRRKRVPAAFDYDSNPREGDPVIVANGPYAIRAHAPASGAPDRPPELGVHGYDPRAMKSMRALFIAVGPIFVPVPRSNPSRM